MAFAEALRSAAGADFALIDRDWTSTETLWSAGNTRQMDAAALNCQETALLMDLNGKEIKRLAPMLAEAEKKRLNEKEPWLRSVPRLLPEPTRLQDERMYRVALPTWGIWSFASTTQSNPESLRITDLSIREVVLRYMTGDDIQP